MTSLNQTRDAAAIPAREGLRRGQPLSRILLDDGTVAATAMLDALATSDRLAQPLARVLTTEGLASPETVLRAQAERFGALVLDRDTTPPDPRALEELSPAFCLKHAVLPWGYVGDRLLIATAYPERFEKVRDILPPRLGAVLMGVTPEPDIHALIAERHGAALAARAETQRPEIDSCRDLNDGTPRSRLLGAGLAAVCLGLLWLAPNVLFAAAVGLAMLAMTVAQGLKLAALIAAPRQRLAQVPPRLPDSPPRVSLLVPLFHESAIADALLVRLDRLTYPRSLLEVLLILEEGDTTTRAALDGLRLPFWVRVVTVPSGAVQTKPRALNYALNFATGSVIGVYDAEDAPAPDQIDRVVAHFAGRSDQVACVQGILDFYNPRANWLSRCFSIEYASWFRLILPGLARMGLAVPLGGTTVFFRREALEAVGGWDAHNVTEDADLGFLLARRGYVTDLLPTVTREEANNRLWPWVRQRSRWLKGYAVTWWVHSRRPRTLWRELGPRRFMGMQALLLATVVQFALAPLLWSFWLILFALPHPAAAHLPGPALTALAGAFLTAEGVSLLVGLAAVARSPHPHLMLWVPTLVAYAPLGTLAIYKALWELIRRPFYWDKTQHGCSAPDPEA